MKYCLAVLPEIDRVLRAAKRILIATDFDGTLCPIADAPSHVHLTPAMLEILQYASDCERITLSVISGRGLEDVRRRLLLDIIFAGNHGLEIAGGGLRFEHAGALEFRQPLAGACQTLGAILHEWPSAWIEDKGLSVTLHFRKVEPRDHPGLLFSARRALGAYGSKLALRVGNKALEIRPKVQWDKGSALRYIQERAGPFDLSICVGDDRTDETMFRANTQHLNIRVGSVNGSAAALYLSDPTEVAMLLSHIVDICNFETSIARSASAYTSVAYGAD